jgi:hypothetical protein
LRPARFAAYGLIGAADHLRHALILGWLAHLGDADAERDRDVPGKRGYPYSGYGSVDPLRDRQKMD